MTNVGLVVAVFVLVVAASVLYGILRMGIGVLNYVFGELTSGGAPSHARNRRGPCPRRNCGKINASGARFCARCGCRLNG